MGVSIFFGAGVAIFGAVSVHGAVGGRTELAAGSAPITPSEPAQAAVTAEVTPGAALGVNARRWQFESGYALRMFYRAPNALELDRPLFLQRARLGHTVRLDRRLTLQSSATGSYGEVDYTETSAVFDPTQTSQLDQPVIDFYDVEARTALDARVERRTGVSGGVLFGRSAPLQPGTGLPVHTRVGVASEYRHQLTRRDEAALPVSVEHHTLDDAALVALSAELGWRRRASRRTTVALAVGALHAEPVSEQGESSLLPTGRASVEHALRRERGFSWDSRATISLRAALDVLRVEYRPIAGIEAATELAWFPRWSSAVRAAWYTAATAEPLGTGEPETTFRAEAPVIFAATPEVALEAGLRTGWRAPHWSEGFDVEQLELWVYAAVTARFGSPGTHPAL